MHANNAGDEGSRVEYAQGISRRVHHCRFYSNVYSPKAIEIETRLGSEKNTILCALVDMQTAYHCSTCKSISCEDHCSQLSQDVTSPEEAVANCIGSGDDNSSIIPLVELQEEISSRKPQRCKDSEILSKPLYCDVKLIA
jgi:hypothetical protein